LLCNQSPLGGGEGKKSGKGLSPWVSQIIEVKLQTQKNKLSFQKKK
jgi:hypothetical protein